MGSERLAVCYAPSRRFNFKRLHRLSSIADQCRWWFELDNPTNLGVSDFSLVATTLDTNNAYKFMSGIEGWIQFGKVCAELKLWVIDLECLAAAEG